MGFKEVKFDTAGDKFKFEKPGDKLQGYYLGSDTINIKGKEVIKHTFQLANGEMLSPLGNYNLDKGLAEVTEGTMVRVTYTESKRTATGGNVKIYKIEEDAEDVLAGFVRPQSTADKIKRLKDANN